MLSIIITVIRSPSMHLVAFWIDPMCGYTPFLYFLALRWNWTSHRIQSAATQAPIMGIRALQLVACFLESINCLVKQWHAEDWRWHGGWSPHRLVSISQWILLWRVTCDSWHSHLSPQGSFEFYFLLALNDKATGARLLRHHTYMSVLRAYVTTLRVESYWIWIDIFRFLRAWIFLGEN